MEGEGEEAVVPLQSEMVNMNPTAYTTVTHEPHPKKIQNSLKAEKYNHDQCPATPYE